MRPNPVGIIREPGGCSGLQRAKLFATTGKGAKAHSHTWGGRVEVEVESTRCRIVSESSRFGVVVIEFGRALLGLIPRAKVWAEPGPEADLVAVEPPPQEKVPQCTANSGLVESNRLGAELTRSRTYYITVYFVQH